MKKMLAEQEIKEDYAESWHHPQTSPDFNLADLDGQTCDSNSNKDRDKNTLYNGQLKSFVDYYGKVGKGKIYHNINNMWWVITGPYQRWNIAAPDLFDETLKQRLSRMIPRVKLSISVGKEK